MYYNTHILSLATIFQKLFKKLTVQAKRLEIKDDLPTPAGPSIVIIILYQPKFIITIKNYVFVISYFSPQFPIRYQNFFIFVKS